MAAPAGFTGGNVTSIDKKAYDGFSFVKESANNKTVFVTDGIDFVCSNKEGWYLNVKGDLEGTITVAYKISNDYFTVDFNINGAGKYWVGDGSGSNGLNHAKVGAFVPAVVEPDPETIITLKFMGRGWDGEAQSHFPDLVYELTLREGDEIDWAVVIDEYNDWKSNGGCWDPWEWEITPWDVTGHADFSGLRSELVGFDEFNVGAPSNTKTFFVSPRPNEPDVPKETIKLNFMGYQWDEVNQRVGHPPVIAFDIDLEEGKLIDWAEVEEKYALWVAEAPGINLPPDLLGSRFQVHDAAVQPIDDLIDDIYFDDEIGIDYFQGYDEICLVIWCIEPDVPDPGCTCEPCPEGDGCVPGCECGCDDCNPCDGHDGGDPGCTCVPCPEGDGCVPGCTCGCDDCNPCPGHDGDDPVCPCDKCDECGGCIGDCECDCEGCFPCTCGGGADDIYEVVPYSITGPERPWYGFVYYEYYVDTWDLKAVWFDGLFDIYCNGDLIGNRIGAYVPIDMDSIERTGYNNGDYKGTGSYTFTDYGIFVTMDVEWNSDTFVTGCTITSISW